MREKRERGWRRDRLCKEGRREKGGEGGREEIDR